MKSSWIVAVLATLLVVSAAYGFVKDHQASEWEQRAVVALDSTETWMARARSLQEAAGAWSRQAHELADRAQQRDTVIVESIRTVRESTPPEIRVEPSVVARDSIIDELVVTNNHWQQAFEQQARAYILSQESARTYKIAADSLRAVLEDRPEPRAWWIPQVGVGGFTGYCPNLGTCSGVGVTLSWRIF